MKRDNRMATMRAGPAAWRAAVAGAVALLVLAGVAFARVSVPADRSRVAVPEGGAREA